MMPDIRLTRVPVAPMPYDRFEPVLGEEQYQALKEAIARAAGVFDGRVVFNVNSTAKGGGVVEMLVSLLAYTRGANIDTRWHVIGGEPAFFRLTKRLHNSLHGSTGDGGPIGVAEREVYERVLDANARQLVPLVRERDIVLLHDPQTAGLVDALKDTGAHVVWRAHIGLDLPNDTARMAWDFLRPYVDGADAYVFSRRAFAWEGLDPTKVTVIPPSIDAFSPKNQELTEDQVRGILRTAGIVADGEGDATFTRADGTPGRVDLRAELTQDVGLRPEDPVVVQVSRWDRLKDPIGVLTGFARHVAPRHDCHLVLAGPDVRSVADDPEGLEVLAEVQEAWRELPAGVRCRIHLACLPMDDVEENAAIVNALQRHAAVVVQKSLAEGFGLTVAEAMWKGRPVVATRVGGIQDQIVHGTTGLLLDDPHDLEAFGAAVCRLLRDPDAAERMGAEAQRRVVDNFLGPRHLVQYLDLFERLLGGVQGVDHRGGALQLLL